MRRRNGFTLIELMVVIAILVILIGLVVFGLSKVVGTQKATATGLVMQNLKSMVTEYEVVTKNQPRQPGHMYFNGVRVPPNTTDPIPPGMNIWKDADPSGTAADPAMALQAPKSLKIETSQDPAEPVNYRYSKGAASDAVANTQLIMGQLLQAPNNKSTLQQVQTSQLMEKIPASIAATNLSMDNPATTRVPSPPVILDAWGNPIIWVPAAGLWDVYAGAKYYRQVQTPPVPNDGPLKSPDGKGFWASAGPDGAFGGYFDKNNNSNFDDGTDTPYGDDNIYSFEN